MSERLRLNGFLSRSRANGPGVRAVVWVQGCTLACPGCFNPNTHTNQPARVADVRELADTIARTEGIEGITLTGGEPFQQARAVRALLRMVRRRMQETTLSVVVFTGYTWKEIKLNAVACSCFEEVLVDVVLLGRYQQGKPRTDWGLAGLPGKTIHFHTNRYTLADLRAVPDGEVRIAPDGTMTSTGIDPLVMDGSGSGV
jgi:anaerobic ribonucleoside-triphosphate reductase activating protein